MTEKDNMRVLISSHAYSASHNRRDKLARLAKNSEIELGVVCPANWYDKIQQTPRVYEKIVEDDLYEVFPLKTFLPGSDLKFFYSPFDLLRIVSRFNPDIIHLEQEPNSLVLFEFTLLNRLFWHKPLIFFTWENLEWVKNPFLSFIRFFNLQNANFAICGNLEAKELLEKNGFKGEMKVFPQFGVDEGEFSPQDVADFKKDFNLGDKFVIGCVGRFAKEKGIKTLLRALSRLPENCLLLLVSSASPPLQLLEEIRSVGVESRVKIFFGIDHKEFPCYMNLFDVAVLPSETTPFWKEQFGRVMIEAMACGVPVIGSSSGAIPEVIGDAGLIFEEKNAGDLQKKIMMLIKDNVFRKELSQKARNRVLSFYTHDRIVQQTVAVYKKILEDRVSL